SSPTSMASSTFLLTLSEGSSPKGSSPVLCSGLRQRSRISRKAALLARSPRKPSSSLSSILKLSTSTDGSLLAPCPAMPVVVIRSLGIFPALDGMHGDNGSGTHWFHGLLWPAAAASRRAETCQIPHIRRFFGSVCLDSAAFTAIKPVIRRGISCAACFC